MRWICDGTGRFAQRPHYDTGELDARCEAIITSFLRARHGEVTFPIDTDDLVVLLEREAGDVDIFADLSNEGPDVEGVTYFNPGGRPDVKIARRLSEDPWAIHRFRTTATHELGHVVFHNLLWPIEPQPDLFSDLAQTVVRDTPRCRRDTIQPTSRVDWMEWQAGYACGAFLMPDSHLKVVAQGARKGAGPPALGEADGSALIQAVAEAFNVSLDAARVRLRQCGLLAAVPSRVEDLFA